MTGNRPEHFQLQELVDRATFEKYGEDAWSLFNPMALEALDGTLGSMVIAALSGAKVDPAMAATIEGIRYSFEAIVSSWLGDGISIGGGAAK